MLLIDIARDNRKRRCFLFADGRILVTHVGWGEEGGDLGSLASTWYSSKTAPAVVRGGI